MDKIEQRFLSILQAALKGGQQDAAMDMTPAEWMQLLALSEIHHVLPLVFETVCRLPELREPVFAQVRQRVVQQVTGQALKTREFLELYRHLQQAGLKPLLVKGAVCRGLYPYPDHRPSGDEDVLISPAEFAQCHDAMAAWGMETGATARQMETDYEIPYGKQGSRLYIELHRCLFSPLSGVYGAWNRYFEDAFQRAVTVEIEGVPVYTLDWTENLFYLICHAFKHFLHSGFGIRQVCDIVLFANRYGSRINWNQLLTLCRAIRADKFAAAVFRIGEKYLVFDPDAAGFPDAWRKIRVDEGPMLEDLLAGGLYGDATMSRKHSSNMTLGAAARGRSQKSGTAVIGALFPPAQKLKGRYGYLEEQPYLLPVAWADRIVRYGMETRKQEDSSAADAVRIGNARIALMKLYGIIE